MQGEVGGRFKLHKTGVEFFVRLTPKSSRDAVESFETAADGRTHLKARVRAVPEKGKANEALLKLIAGFLRVPARDVMIVSGDSARLKCVRVEGDAQELTAKLAAIS